MSVNIQEKQRASVIRMLQLEESKHTWKILVYDKLGQDVLTTLFKVGELRDLGVSLNLSLDSKRDAVPEVPVVYFLSPTEENVEKIVQDLATNLYQSIYVNFASQTPQNVLKALAQGASRVGRVKDVLKVTDSFLSFITLGPRMFTLNEESSFGMIHRPGTSNEEMVGFVDRTVNGLLSLCVSLGNCPVIRCPKKDASPARAIGYELLGKLQNLKDSKTTTFQRPLLILLDRDTDLTVMLHHTWTYSSLIHDLLNFSSNRVTFTSDEKKLVYDRERTDELWNKLGDETFPIAAQEISSCLQQYNTKVKEMGRTNQRDLGSAISALPEMTETKRFIDMHTNIATALVTQIRNRSIDKFYETEDEYSTITERAALQRIDLLFKTDGTKSDKERAALCLSMSRKLSEEGMKELQKLMLLHDLDIGCVRYMSKHLSRELSTTQVDGACPVICESSKGSQFSEISNLMIDKGRGLILKGIKQLQQKTLPICKIVEDLLFHNNDNLITAIEKKTTTNQQYLTLDHNNSDNNAKVTKLPFKNVLVFVIGGGNYVESAALHKLALKHNKQFIYGATDIIPPSRFLHELQSLAS